MNCFAFCMVDLMDKVWPTFSSKYFLGLVIELSDIVSAKIWLLYLHLGNELETEVEKIHAICSGKQYMNYFLLLVLQQIVEVFTFFSCGLFLYRLVINKILCSLFIIGNHCFDCKYSTRDVSVTWRMS